MDIGQLFTILINTVFVFEFIAAITATYYFKKFWNSQLKYFFVFLWLVVITEFIGIYIFKFGPQNVGLYNISKVIQVTYLLLLFRSYIQSSWVRRVGLLAPILFILGIVINLIVLGGIHLKQASYGFTFGSVVLLLMIAGFFYEILKTDAVLNIWGFTIAWVGAFLFAYHAITMPLNSIANWIPEITNDNGLLIIKGACNILMYIGFIVGLIWGKKYKF